MHEDVLVAADGDGPAVPVLGRAIGVARRDDATLHLLHVRDTGAVSLDPRSGARLAAAASDARERVRTLAERARQRDVEVVTAFREGDTHREILAHVDAVGADLVVLPADDRNAVSRLLFGSATDRVARNSPVPVLLVPLGR